MAGARWEVGQGEGVFEVAVCEGKAGCVDGGQVRCYV